MIPCIREKCLKYPVCKSSKQITCTDLRMYLVDNQFNERHRWKLLNHHFPNIKRLGVSQVYGYWYPPLTNPKFKEEKSEESFKFKYLTDKIPGFKPIMGILTNVWRSMVNS